MASKIRLILASASPRRRNLLKKAGYRFAVIVSGVSERGSSHQKPRALVKTLARRKAMAVAKRYPDDIILGADTIVFVHNRVVGKPKNPKHAERILRVLSGARQQVLTGVSVVWGGGRWSLTGCASSWVQFRVLSDEEIQRAAYKHLDKAGGYAVQSKGDRFVKRIVGDYDNVVGLPMKLVNILMRRACKAFAKNIGENVDFKLRV